MAESGLFQPKTILCPYDYSELSKLALKYAAVGVRHFGGRLEVMYAQTFEIPRYFNAEQVQRFDRELQEARAQASGELDRHIAQILGPSAAGLKVDARVEDIHPTQAISDRLAEGVVDLVVMGTHGHGGVRHLLMGSVTEAVVAAARIPVFTVRQKEHAFIDPADVSVEPHIGRILCPTNRSRTAGAALRIAASLAERYGAVLTVLQSLEPRQAGNLPGSRNDLCGWVAETAKVRCEWQPVVKQAHAADGIVDYARETRQDLIVLGALRHPFQQGSYFGRTTDLVLRYAPAPVLVVPQPA